MVSGYRKMSLTTLLSANDAPPATHPNGSIEALVHPRKGSLAYIVHDWPSAMHPNQDGATVPSTSQNDGAIMDRRQEIAPIDEVTVRHKSPTPRDPAHESQAMKDTMPAQGRVDPNQTRKRKREEKDDDATPTKKSAKSRWNTGHEFIRNSWPMSHRVPENKGVTDEGDRAHQEGTLIPTIATIDATDSRGNRPKRRCRAQESEVLLRRSARIKTLRAQKTQDNRVAKRARP
ncbi:hypothetical protein F5I97DRAFT_1925006 [Phlebopus sp. FC_14]|nr:hypothetical protein F5I97DRAFT_1925006 [Phlebopus sp. FC_14]